MRAAAQETIKLLKELQKIEGGGAATAADLGLEMKNLVKTTPTPGPDREEEFKKKRF